MGNIVPPGLCSSRQLVLGPSVPNTIGPRDYLSTKTVNPKSSCPLLDPSVPLLPFLLHPRPTIVIRYYS